MSAAEPRTEAPRATGVLQEPVAQAALPSGHRRSVYLLWSLLPVVIAVIFSFNAGRSRISWQGFSLRWWTGDPTDSLFHDTAMRAAMAQTFKLSILTVLIAVPLGTLFAIGIDRWHGRPARTANFAMLLSFVVPEIILGVSLFILFTSLLKNVIPLGTNAQLFGLVSYQISYPDDHRAGPPAHDRARVRGGGDGPGRHARPVDPARAAPAARAGDPRERRARVRRQRRRLRHGCRPLRAASSETVAIRRSTRRPAPPPRPR